VREENAIAALEVISRFAANPKWLIYLPPTMSPTETSQQPGLLEHPAEAFAYYRSNGIGKVICEEKHMGSRAVVVLCRDNATAVRRFGIDRDGAGIIYTRTGRRFFEDRTVEAALLEHLRSACTSAGFWEEFNSDWFCFDCELMPWSAKAQELLKNQYAAVGSAGRAGLTAAVELLEQTVPRFRESQDGAVATLLDRYRNRHQMIIDYVAAYRGYCWPVHSVRDLKLAPFHLLASENKVHIDQDHQWHMLTMSRLAAGVVNEPTPVISTRHRIVDVTDAESETEGIQWWIDLTRAGGEGMVVKPLEFVVRGKHGLVQPAVKCRGPEYLRIIYGPEYDAPENIARLRSRGVGAKRALAIREFALGIEALERFVRREPLRRVHECIFGVLAMESEPVDARL
jgi:protein phosphatase